MNKRIFPALLFTLISPFCVAYSQDTTLSDEDNVDFELSPFIVDGSQDTGYRAANTLSGTRLNSSLRDTSASVSVWTQELLEDTGLIDIDELIAYSVSTVLNLEDQDGPGGAFNNQTNATAVTQRIRTRGVEATRGLDYFKSITPDDSYRIARYDDSRGPNGVLFGVSQAGGLINQSSFFANAFEDSGRVRYSFGSASRNRAEFRFNKVILQDKLGLAVAGLNQENGHWRDWGSEDKERIYGSFTWHPTEKITFRANYEDGLEHRTTIQPSPVVDLGLPWYDYSLVTPLEDITFNPYRAGGAGAELNTTTRSLGLVSRDGTPRNANRFTYVENDDTIINVVGNYRTDGYRRTEVVPVDGSPQMPSGSRNLRIDDPDFLPYFLNAGGPDFYRETDFSNYAAFLDVEITDNWFLNVQFGNQRSIIDVPQIPGARPAVEFDPNTTKDAINPDGPANPYLGRMFFDGDYRRDKNHSFYEEIRVSTSYDLDTDSDLFGRHRIAIAASQVDEQQRRGNTWLAIGGNPQGRGSITDFYGNRFTSADYDHVNYRVTSRNYVDLDDFSTWRVGSWRSVPETITTDRYEGVPTTYPVVWAEDNPSNFNYLINSVTDTHLAVSQSHLLDDRLVFTLGYRKDEVTIDRAGYRRDPLIGFIPDLSITPDTAATDDISPAAPPTDFEGTVRTYGMVFHVNDNLSLVANAASSIGIPDFRQTVYPEGSTAPPSKGDGLDLGIDFSLFDNRVSGRLVYYETDSNQEVVGGNDLARSYGRMFDSLEEAFEDAGNTALFEELANLRTEIRPEVIGRFQDIVSSGYELRITANLTSNWRLQLNAAKVDRSTSNSYSRTVPFLGLTRAEGNLVVQGVTEAGEIPDPGDPDSTITAYTIDRSAYTPDGAISQLLDYEDQLPDGETFDTIRDGGNRSVARNLFEVVDEHNRDIRVWEKRWGLRPYRFNVFTNYDFKEGLLRGWSVGGGYRYNAPNIIGEEDGVEFEGGAQQSTDFLLRYSTKKIKSFLGEGRWTYQLNINNVFNNRDTIPSRLALDGNITQMVPGDRGFALARFDLPTPREYRFTVTYDF